MPIQQINGSAIHYQKKGSGPLLVLLHAFPADARMWSAQFDELSSRFRVITPDFPGFGKSPGNAPFTVPSMAEDIHEFLLSVARASSPCLDPLRPNEREDGVEPNTGRMPVPLVLGGLSMGGYVAMNYAKMFPGDLHGLILADTKDAADNAEQRENRNRMIEVVRTKGSPAIAEMMIGKMLSPDTAAHRSGIVKSLRNMMESCPAATIEHALAALRDRPDMSEELAKITVPTLILVGDADAITPPGIAQAMREKIRGSKLEVIPGAGHMSAMEQPTLVTRAIGRFMERIG
jgi:pimeloyl-ACP methyl ester carboxylesterase